jgi:hypothetical protein
MPRHDTHADLNGDSAPETLRTLRSFLEKRLAILGGHETCARCGSPHGLRVFGSSDRLEILCATHLEAAKLDARIARQQARRAEMRGR